MTPFCRHSLSFKVYAKRFEDKRFVKRVWGRAGQSQAANINCLDAARKSVADFARKNAQRPPSSR